MYFQNGVYFDYCNIYYMTENRMIFEHVEGVCGTSKSETLYTEMGERGR